ncbi:MAG: tyrosine recombinase XerC [Melioribacteraceae bacterium]|nr:tyrosine recombinase XerC [Melioribacteraceae bacterium]
MNEINLNSLINEFLSEIESVKRYSANTISSYKIDLTQFQKFTEEKNISTIRQVSEKTIKHYLIHLNQLQLSKSTVSRKLSSLRSFFDFIIQSIEDIENPAKRIKNPKFKRKLPEIINLDSFLKIITFIDEDQDVFRRNLNKTIFELLYGCSLRVTELCDLNIHDVDFSKNTVKVLGKGSKYRIVPLGSKSSEIIKEYFDQRKNITASNHFLVSKDGNTIDRWYVYRVVKKYIGKENDIEKKSPHVLRHSSATEMLNKGADLMAVKEILGHQNLSTTQIYTQVSIEQLKKTYKSAHPKS